MKILLLGKEGQLGWELQRTLAPLGQVFAYNRKEFDLNVIDSLRAYIRQLRPTHIVNAAAYTAVDKAATDRELAFQINATAPGLLAEEARNLDAWLVHYSTDYIFDGKKNGAYDEDDHPVPLNDYGKSKLAGEEAVQAAGEKYLILRTSWVYGLRGKNFLNTMLQLLEQNKELKVVNDQFGSPTWSRLIAEATAQILVQDHPYAGVYNLSCSGKTSWYEFAKSIFAYLDRVAHLSPISSAQYPSKTIRPANSVLSNAKIGRDFGIFLPSWEKALKLCLES